MKWRVVYRQRASEPWQEAYFATCGAAYRFKQTKRRQLWSAFVQCLHADGVWEG